jgi:propanol-preferring alcohol dehydrogenase
VTTHIESTEPLENINDIFSRMHDGAITGRVVLDMTNGAE